MSASTYRLQALKASSQSPAKSPANATGDSSAWPGSSRWTQPSEQTKTEALESPGQCSTSIFHVPLHSKPAKKPAARSGSSTVTHG